MIEAAGVAIDRLNLALTAVYNAGYRVLGERVRGHDDYQYRAPGLRMRNDGEPERPLLVMSGSWYKPEPRPVTDRIGYGLKILRSRWIYDLRVRYDGSYREIGAACGLSAERVRAIFFQEGRRRGFPESDGWYDERCRYGPPTFNEYTRKSWRFGGAAETDPELETMRMGLGV